jgi:hypothetical protein
MALELGGYSFEIGTCEIMVAFMLTLIDMIAVMIL